jgi:predicted dehydrogenase
MIRIGVIGVGKIARDRHLPSIAASAEFVLAGLADPGGAPPEVYPSHAAMFAAVPEMDAVAICTPPSVRFAVACDALAAGRHVLLEKPPAAGLGELEALRRLAASHGRVLFTAWHSQHNDAVAEAGRVLAGKAVARVQVTWREDFRKYHPGQRWIWQAGGFGVFDAGINALSILSRILPGRLHVRAADLFVPADCAAPIRATLQLGADGPGIFAAELDWNGNGAEQREIEVDTACGMRLRLTQSGGRLELDGREVVGGTRSEYPMLYARFAALIAAGTSAVDAEPLRMVADAFLLGHRIGVAPISLQDG